MTEQEYLEQVLEVVHARTLADQLHWRVNGTEARVKVSEQISAVLRFDVTGPDTAKWEEFYVTTPDLAYFARIGRSGSALSLKDRVAKGLTLARIDEIFAHAYLEPRRRAVAEALEEVKGQERSATS